MLLPTALLLGDPVASQAAGSAPGADLTWLATVMVVFVVTIAVIAFAFRTLLGGALRSRASKRDLQVLDVLPLGSTREFVA